MPYVELPADHAMTAFLSTLTIGKVLRDRERNFSKSERKRQRFLREKSRTEFNRAHLAVADRWAAQHEKKAS